MLFNSIEITGIPCCGKSHFCDQEKVINSKSKNLLKKIVIDIYFVMRGGGYLFSSNRCLKFMRLAYKECVPFSYKLKLFRNVCRKFGVFASIKNCHQSGYVDEGVSHIPFNFLNSDSREVIKLIKHELQYLTVVLLPSPNDNILKERLKKRGHPRLMFCDIDSFIKLNQQVESFIKERYISTCLDFKVITYE